MHTEIGSSKKNDAITIAKALGIILMVLAHARCPQWLEHFIWMFHMPLFFCVSGYCFKDKYLGDAKTFVMKRIKALYIPFVKWSLVFLVLHNFFYSINIYNDIYGFEGEVSYIYSVKDFLKGVKNIDSNV